MQSQKQPMQPSDPSQREPLHRRRLRSRPQLDGKTAETILHGNSLVLRLAMEHTDEYDRCWSTRAPLRGA